MAEAKKTTYTETVVVEKEGIELILTTEEAMTLVTLLRETGGLPSNTARRYADSILNALATVVRRKNYFKIDMNHTGGIFITSDLVPEGVNLW